MLFLVWDIQWTDECRDWVSALDSKSREDILACLILLRERGPSLGRPYADTIAGSRIKNLKELRVQSKRRVIRIFFVFTKSRVGLLLAGEDKRGKKRFYEEMIPRVEKLYAAWLEEQGEG